MELRRGLAARKASRIWKAAGILFCRIKVRAWLIAFSYTSLAATKVSGVLTGDGSGWGLRRAPIVKPRAKESPMQRIEKMRQAGERERFFAAGGALRVWLEGWTVGSVDCRSRAILAAR